MTAKKSPLVFESEVRAVWGDKVELLTPYTRDIDKVLVKFKDCGHECWKSPSKLLAGQGCNIKHCRYGLLSRNKTRSTEQFANDLASKGYRYELLSEFKGVSQQITVKNLSCNHIYTARAGNILNKGSGCPICHGVKDTNGFIDVLQKKYGNAYTVLGTYVNNRTPILVRHSCGYEWECTPKGLLRHETCPRCNKSVGEKRIENFLKAHHITYYPQYWFPDCRDKLPLPFDFAVLINGKIRLIEFDGTHHYNTRGKHWNQENNFEYVLRHDAIKNIYCRENGYPLLRIPYWKSNSFDKMLSDFLDISD